MNLVLFFLLAAVAVWTSVYFLRAKGVSAAGDDAQAARPAVQSLIHEAGDLPFLWDAIFSEADWRFILNERSPLLTELFTEERRALAVQWLNDRAARIRAVRAKHLENSRYSQDLNVLAELKLLALFQYLIVLCGCMSLVVRVAEPTAPRKLALHFEKMAGRLGPGQEAAIPHVPAPAEELPRSRP
jgi:hypothetical protein